MECTINFICCDRGFLINGHYRKPCCPYPNVQKKFLELLSIPKQLFNSFLSFATIVSKHQRESKIFFRLASMHKVTAFFTQIVYKLSTNSGNFVHVCQNIIALKWKRNLHECVGTVNLMLATDYIHFFFLSFCNISQVSHRTKKLSIYLN